jgi:flap endonuclease-1
MGIKNLMKLLIDKTSGSIHQMSNSELKNKKVAIDTSIVLYQYVTAVRSTGDDLKGPDGKSTTHIQAMMSKTLNCLKMDVTPVFVFDGKPPQLKMKILNDRSKIKKDAINKLVEIEEKLDVQPDAEIKLDQETLDMLEAEKIKLLKQSVSISHSEMLQAYEIAQLLGVPAIIAPEEADSQCAYLSKNDLVDFVASEDMDLLTFGSKIVVRNFAKKGMLKINLNQILNLGNITMDQFIDICILLGCDYTATIDGIGPKRAWDLIKKYGSLEELIAKDNGIAQAKYKLPDNFRYEESREYFLNPRHVEIDPTNLELKTPKLNELKTLLMSKYGFAEDNIEKMIGFLRKKHNIIDKAYSDKKTAEENEDPFIDDEVVNISKVSKNKTKSKSISAKSVSAKSVSAKPISTKPLNSLIKKNKPTEDLSDDEVMETIINKKPVAKYIAKPMSKPMSK